jgi:hypothetical protein
LQAKIVVATIKISQTSACSAGTMNLVYTIHSHIS